MSGIPRSSRFLPLVFLLAVSAFADSTNAPPAGPATAIPSTNAAAAVPLPADIVTRIAATKKCDQVELSPDKQWLAATRSFTVPDRNAIWEDTGSRCALLVREVDGNGELGSDILYWEDPALGIVKIAWSPDSRFLAVVCTANDGHQPWSLPTFIVDIEDGTLRGTDPLGTIVSQDVKFTDSGALQFCTGLPSAPTSNEFDVAKHLANLPVLLKIGTQ